MKPPQLSLRELFLLLALAAMGCGWWVDHRRLEQELVRVDPSEWQLRAEKLAQYVRESGGTVSWEQGSIAIEGCGGIYLDAWPLKVVYLDELEPHERP